LELPETDPLVAMKHLFRVVAQGSLSLALVAHPEASRASIASIRSFSFDERLWRAR
jgi:hypothetical protein